MVNQPSVKHELRLLKWMLVCSNSAIGYVQMQERHAPRSKAGSVGRMVTVVMLVLN